MRLEIAERLRCPRSHAPTPLVLVAERVVERELVDGVAGCPVCLREARIIGGNVNFGEDALQRPAGAGYAAGAASEDAGAIRTQLERLMALLLLGEPGGAVLLTGRYAQFAAPLAQQLDLSAVVMGAAPAAALGVSCVRLAEPVVPFSDHTFRAAALDASLPAALVADAVRSVEIGGRVVGTAALPLPPLLRELARDQDEWLAERESGPSGVVRIRRA